MTFYGTFKSSKGLAESPTIDYICFKFKKVPEEFLPDDFNFENEDVELSSFWDESDWDYDADTGDGWFRCKGIYVNDIYANDHIDMFEDAKVVELQVHTPASCKFSLTSLEAHDLNEMVIFLPDQLIPDNICYEA